MRNVIIGLLLFCLVPFAMLAGCKKKEEAPTPLSQTTEIVKAVNGIDIGYTKFQIEGYNYVLINVKGTNQYQILDWHGYK